MKSVFILAVISISIFLVAPDWADFDYLKQDYNESMEGVRL